MSEEHDLRSRALAAWFRWCSPDEAVAGIPVTSMREAGGKRYVMLRSGKGTVLRVYRVRNDGMLKGLKRWPKALEEQP